MAESRISLFEFHDYISRVDMCRSAKVLENRITADEERIKLLEKELEMAIVFGEEADRKYEEVSRPIYTANCYNSL